MSEEIVKAINDFGFPVIAAFGLGYFVYYTWNWVLKDIKPVLDESTGTLIGLIDRIRMLDNDMIRLNTKIQMILQERDKNITQNRRKNKHILDDNRYQYILIDVTSSIMRYIWLLLLLSSSAIADELKFRFKSPSFTGIGYSAHKINLENISAARKKTIKDELKSLSIQANLANNRKPLTVFLTNLQSRIYSELSKQVTEQLFADAGSDSGSFDLDGNVISWYKLADKINLTVVDTDGDLTTILIPIGSLLLPEPVNEETTAE